MTGQTVDVAPHLGGKLSAFIFGATLFAFVAESQLTQYVQTTLSYRHPYFIFYTVHSSFLIIFPLHLLYLKATTSYSTRSLFSGLSKAITHRLYKPTRTPNLQFPLYRFCLLVLGMTVGVTIPACLWFVAITLASITDVTAIWNTNAFFAYVITVRLFGMKWESRKLLAVVLATCGTFLVVYGGASHEPTRSQGDEPKAKSFQPTAPLAGDLLTLIASFAYGLYQVLYKKYCALPTDPEVIADGLYQQLPESDEPDEERERLTDIVYPPPFGLYPNLLTAAIGLMTLLTCWLPLPFLHVLAIEPFSLPTDLRTVLAIAGISLTGVAFNAGFMILLGVWGPIMTSVGSLLTIVLVFISDVVFGSGLEAVTGLNLLGSTVIVFAFGVLAYDVFNMQ